MSIEVLTDTIVPAHRLLEPYAIADTDAARAMMYAIGLQESGLIHRYQVIPTGAYRRGPARGLWQFESGGGVRGVLSHTSTSVIAHHFARFYVGSISADAVWVALEHIDMLAAVFARLLLWTDPRALPVAHIDNAREAWAYYERNWRPGKPHPDRWPPRWAAAVGMVRSAELATEALD